MTSTKIIKDVSSRSPHFLTRLFSYGEASSSSLLTAATVDEVPCSEELLLQQRTPIKTTKKHQHHLYCSSHSHSSPTEDSTSCSTSSMSFSVRSLPLEVEVVYIGTDDEELDLNNHEPMDDPSSSTDRNTHTNSNNSRNSSSDEEEHTELTSTNGGGVWDVDRTEFRNPAGGSSSSASMDSSSSSSSSTDEQESDRNCSDDSSTALTSPQHHHDATSIPDGGPVDSSTMNAAETEEKEWIQSNNDIVTTSTPARRGSSHKSLNKINEALDQLEETDAEYWTLIHLKAKSLARKGYYKSSLALYEKLLQWQLNSDLPIQTVAKVADLYFAAGRLSVYLGEYEKALEYYQFELIHTQAIIGTDDLAVARIYHELARVAECGLGDLPQALGYYQNALRVERAVSDRISRGGGNGGIEPCSDCSHLDGEIVLCPTHSADREVAAQQMQETRQCMGRIHFALGDIEKAVQLSVRKLF